MNRKKLIIFPEKKQVEYICSMSWKNTVYIILNYDIEVPSKTEVNNCIILRECDSLVEKISEIGMDVDVLCCHEEGLYWLNRFGNSKWNYQFSVKMFDLLTKNKFKDYLFQYDILNAEYYENVDEIRKYPVIMKPIIGFGSIGVKLLNDFSELQKELELPNKESIYQKIKPYQDKYFAGIENSFIFEKYISGYFYRTPFVILENEVAYVFPVRGNNTTYKEVSDFHWTDFEYGVNEKKVAKEISILLRKLMNVFNLKDGVYVAEFIITDNGDIYLLELSPRQTSGRIAKIIKLATGIDLERIAIDIFADSVNIMQFDNRNIRMRIERNDNILAESNYEIIEVKQEKSVYGDIIKTIYYERKDYEQ